MSARGLALLGMAVVSLLVPSMAGAQVSSLSVGVEGMF